MALDHNNPGYYYISWKDLLITYEGTQYKIQNSHTDLKYVYWDVANPYELQCFNRTQNTKPGFYQLFINDRGQATERSHEDLIISWDGNNMDLIVSQIYGIHQENKESGKKFVAIETDINGIKQTVGQTQESMTELNERVSQISQTTEGIDLSVKELNQIFADNKELNELRENLNKSIIDFNSSLGIFKSEIYTYYKDNEINEEEKIKINTQLDILDSKKAEVIRYVDIVINMMEVEGQTTQVNKLNSTKTKFINSINNLKTYISTAISDGNVVPSEITGIVDLFAKCNIAINELKGTCDDCIFLGAGGSVSTELARIGIKSDEIILSVSETKETIKTDMDLLKKSLEGQVKDVDGALKDFQNIVNTTFKDGIIDAAEKELLLDRIITLDKEKKDVDSQYNALYEDINLKDPAKTKLKADYDGYISKHNSLKLKLEDVISDNLVNDAEKAQINTLMSEYATLLAKVHKTMNESIDNISYNKAKLEINNAKEELQGNISDVDNKVNDLDGFVNGVFSDGILNKTEKKVLKQNVETLEREKIDVDKKYDELYTNQYLDGQMKSDLKTSYDTLTTSFNNIISFINSLIIKEELITQEDRNNVDNLLSTLKVSLGRYATQYQKAIDYIRKRELDIVKNNINGEISDVNNRVDGILSDIGGAITDGIIDEAEAKMIANHLNILSKEKLDVDERYKTVYNNSNLKGVAKSNLKDAKDDFDLKVKNVIDTINSIIADNKATDVEVNSFNRVIAEYNISSSMLTKRFDEAIDNIAKNMNNDTQTILQDYIDGIKRNLQGEILDVSDSVTNLKKYTDGVFKDGVISEAEKEVYKSLLKTLNTEKIDIDKRYTEIYKNGYLSGTPKTELKTKYDNYTICFSSLITEIEKLLELIIITEVDRERINSAFNGHDHALSNFSVALNNAIDNIAYNKANSRIETVKNNLERDILDVSDVINNLENTMNTSFKDGIVSESEAIAIKEDIKRLNTEKADVEKNYDSLYKNGYLNGSVKTKLQTDYNSYIAWHSDLVKYIETSINDKHVTQEEKDEINTKLISYNRALSEYKVSQTKAIDNISLNQSKGMVDTAKSELKGEIDDVSRRVTDLNGELNGIFKDGIIDAAEIKIIESSINQINKEKVDVNKRFEVLYYNSDLRGDAKSNLNNAKSDFDSKINTLISTINSIIEDGKVTEEEYSNYKARITQYNESSSILTKRFDEAIDNIAKNNTSYQVSNIKSELDGQIADVSNSLGSLETTINTSFKDGIINKTEAIAIKEDIKRLNTEKVDIEKSYADVYNNINLDGVEKTNLKSTYDSYISTHNNLITYINASIADDMVTEEEKNNISSRLTSYNNTLGDYKVAQNKAIDKIVLNKAKVEVNEAKKQLGKEISDVEKEVMNLGDTLNGAFKDEIIDSTEIRIIEEHLRQLDKEKLDIDMQYNLLYNNKDLV